MWTPPPKLDPKRIHTTAEVASLILANAFIFHSELTEVDTRVKHLRDLLKAKDPRGAVIDHWEFIYNTINYVPIFRVARDIMIQLPERAESDVALRHLAEVVQNIVANRAAMRHDLIGRIYHTLLLDAKYLGTYYTSVSAATLLLKVALDPQRWPYRWDSLDDIRQLRIADLACGTGTLLMAAQQAVNDNFVRSTVESGAKVSSSDLRDLHQAMMERVLHGYDVQTSAVHLTASTLSLLAPEIAFRTMNLYSLPLEQRGNDIYLGSIDFATGREIKVQLDLMGEVRQAEVVTGQGGKASAGQLPEEGLDLCVMNPPFTRSVGGNLLFGSLPAKERKAMQKKLADLLKRGSGSFGALQANSTAGLGAVFVAVADRHLKDNGRMALVLPEALAFGIAWQKTRELLAKRYVLEIVITSHDPARWNFSDSTELSEALIVARRRPNGTPVKDEQTVFVNLWHNSAATVNALAVASAIERMSPADMEGGHGVAEIQNGGRKWGELLRVSWAAIKDDQWYPCAFAQTELNRTAHYLRRGELYITPSSTRPDVPLTHLSSLGTLGPDVRDIHDGFRVSNTETSYPAFWGHDAENVISLKMEPNAFLEPLSQPKAGRPLRRVELLWPRAGKVMLAERLWFNTQRVVATRLNEESLAGSWWPFKLHDGNGHLEKALVLWLNSTPGLITLASRRVPTRGAWVKFKKPMYEQMPVLDLWRLTEEQVAALSKTYDEIADEPLKPLPAMADDAIRARIDDALSETLNLPSLTRLRKALAREPIICLQPLY